MNLFPDFRDLLAAFVASEVEFDLIENKRAARRPRDLEDCAELERIRAKRTTK